MRHSSRPCYLSPLLVLFAVVAVSALGQGRPPINEAAELAVAKTRLAANPDDVWAQSMLLWQTNRTAWNVRFAEEAAKLGVRVDRSSVTKADIAAWRATERARAAGRDGLLSCGPVANGTTAALNAYNIVSCGQCGYTWGGENINCCADPSGGFPCSSNGNDCSGLACMSYYDIFALERVTYDQVTQGNDASAYCNANDFGSCCAGDLIFYCFDQPCPSHVAIYVVFGALCECADCDQGCLCRAAYTTGYQTSNYYCGAC